jgi:ligand-binding sensor domain-containing protein
VLVGVVFNSRADAAPVPDWTRFATPLVIPLTREQGLPPGVVKGRARDGEGFLWIATDGGLARWTATRCASSRSIAAATASCRTG